MTPAVRAVAALFATAWGGGVPAPPTPNDDNGRLVKVLLLRGDLMPVTDGEGEEPVLDRPTSLEL